MVDIDRSESEKFLAKKAVYTKIHDCLEQTGFHKDGYNAIYVHRAPIIDYLVRWLSLGIGRLVVEGEKVTIRTNEQNIAKIMSLADALEEKGLIVTVKVIRF